MRSYRATIAKELQLAAQGKQYVAHTTDLAVSDGASIGMVVKTGSKDLLLEFKLAVGGDARLRFLEEPSTMTASTATTFFNSNRVRATSCPATTTLGASPAFTAGSILTDQFIPGGEQYAQGGAAEDLNAWFLDANATYVVAACNKSGGAAEMSLIVKGWEDW